MKKFSQYVKVARQMYNSLPYSKEQKRDNIYIYVNILLEAELGYI